MFGNQQVITEGADEAESVYACDLDADGDLDVLSASRADNKVAWYENQGDGTFRGVARQAGVSLPHRTFATWFFDYDNDGWLDL